MTDLQPTRTSPGEIDTVVSGRKTGDQAKIWQVLRKGLVDRELAGDDQGANDRHSFERRSLPQAPDREILFKVGSQHAEMRLDDQQCGLGVGHWRTFTVATQTS